MAKEQEYAYLTAERPVPLRRAMGMLTDQIGIPNPCIEGTVRYINKHFYISAGCKEMIFDTIEALLTWIGKEITEQIKIHEKAEIETRVKRQADTMKDPIDPRRP